MISPLLVRLSIVLAGLVFCTGLGWAGSWQHAVTSRVSTEFDTNPAMSPTNRDGIWRALFEPSYTLTGTNGADELRAGLALQVARSSNKNLSVDREDPSVFLDWRRRSDTGELGISTKYDEVATRATEADATGLVSADSTRASRALSAIWSKATSERSMLSINAAYTGVSYKGAGAYENYATLSAGMNFSYDWSESIAPFLNISNVNQSPAGGGPSSRRTNTMLGLNWKVSERLDCTMQAGKSKGGGTGGNEDSQYVAGVRYAGMRTQLALNADRQASASGLGGFVTADQVNGSWVFDLNEHSRTGVNIRWRKNRSITDDISTTMDVWLQRDLNSLWGVRTRYMRRTREGGGIGGAASDLLGLSLVYTHSGF